MADSVANDDGVARADVVCPACRAPLATDAHGAARCDGCGAGYPARPGCGPDLRPRQALVREATHRIPPGGTAPSWRASLVPELRPGTGPNLSHLEGEIFTLGNRLSTALASRLELRPGYRLLDLGCGAANSLGSVSLSPGVHHVGVDYEGDGPDYLVDAHALPFADDSFDGVISLAVLEHLRSPHLAAQEVARVLAPGGVFAGTVAFLEPFHEESTFHHSAHGLWLVLHEAGFVDIEIEPNRSWDVVQANLEMGLLPHVPSLLRRLLARLTSGVVHLVWRLTRTGASLERYAEFTGGFRFVARLPR